MDRPASLLALIITVASCSSGGASGSDAGQTAGSGGGGGLAGAAAGGGGDAPGGVGGTGGAAGAGTGGTGDPSIPSFTVELWEYAIGSTTQLAPNIWMTISSQRNVLMNDVAIRYWYTSEVGSATGVSQPVECVGTQGVVCEWFNASIVAVNPARPNADTYLDIDFSPAPANLSFGAYANILLHITRSDGGTYDQSNDYSYNASASALMATDRITVYYKGALAYGVEP